VREGLGIALLPGAQPAAPAAGKPAKGEKEDK
jgi:hypothetical protein